MTSLLKRTPNGLYCEQGNFYVDPWRPVERAVLTHAHADHARPGSGSYLAATPGRNVLRARLGSDANCSFLNYGDPIQLGGVQVTLYPAGHILGSAQVAIERKGEIVVVSGDYKREKDPTCEEFVPIRCQTLVTESTFGLPVFHWQPATLVLEQINRWWQRNLEQGRGTLLLAYSLGKAQRLLAGLNTDLGPILTHGAVEKLCTAYRMSGVRLPETMRVSDCERGGDYSGSLILAPPSAVGTRWMRRLGKVSTGMASGWMQVRGTRRRRAVDRGFVLSDHADWSGLLLTIRESAAEEVWVTHGYSEIMCRFLEEKGYRVRSVDTEFAGESPGEESGEKVEESLEPVDGQTEVAEQGELP